jgi:NHLM bacteriocin system ABC transporter peptidase/ATP-binding protein
MSWIGRSSSGLQRLLPYIKSRFAFMGRRVKTPTVIQMEAVECGAAALKIVLGYHGRIVALEELRLACGVSRDGVKASNVLKAARQYGLTSKGFKCEPDKLRDIRLPFIVFWNFNHFLVVEGIKREKYYLSDPATGPRMVGPEEFNQAFTGVVLTFEKGPEFRRGGKNPSLLRALGNRLRGCHVALCYVLLASFALVIPGLAIPTFTKVFIDNFLVLHMDEWLKPLLVAMAITAILRAVLTHIQLSSLLRLENRLAVSTTGKFFWHILRLPMEFFSQRAPGELVARIEINDKVAGLLSGELATNAVNLLMVGFYALLMFQYDVALTVIGIVTAALNLAALRYVSRKRVDDNRRLLQDQGKLWGVTMGGLLLIETLKSTGSESDFFARWSGNHTKVVNMQQQLGVSSQLLSTVPPMLSGVNAALVLGIGGYRVMDGLLTMGMLVAFQTLMHSFIDPVNKLTDLGGKIQKTEGEMYRLDDVLRYRPDAQAPGTANTRDGEEVTARLMGYVELRNITFGYSRLEPSLIQNFSLKLAPGDRVAIVGSSGSGKSTVAKLVAGLYQPWEGEILFDGQPRNSLSRDLINNSLAMVDQDIFLFEGSVRENLTMWDTSVTEPDLMQASKDAQIYDDLATRGGGYDYTIEEMGRNFSGGQRQRMEIARALANNPRILILDEATAALDAKTEQLVDDALRRRGCTLLIVAHRLSTIRDCDEIIVLDRGKVVERGSHDELANAGGPYSALIRAS